MPCRSLQYPLLPAAKGKVSHGSVLNENYAPTRVTSGCKSTPGRFSQVVLDFQFERLAKRRDACLLSFDSFCHHCLFGTVLDVALLNVVGYLSDLRLRSGEVRALVSPLAEFDRPHLFGVRVPLVNIPGLGSACCDAEAQAFDRRVGEPDRLVGGQGLEVRVGEADRRHLVVPCKTAVFTKFTIRSTAAGSHPNAVQ